MEKSTAFQPGNSCRKTVTAWIRPSGRDCFAPRVTADVVFDGHRLAREFEEADPERHKPYLRERMIWGNDIQPKFQ